MTAQINNTAKSGSVDVQGAYNAENHPNEFITALNAAVDTAPSGAAANDETAELLRLLSESRVDENESITPDEFLFSWQGVDFMPRQNLVSIKAPAKSGKTFALTAFCTAFLKRNYMGLQSYATSADKVLFVDTEQSRNDTRKTLQRIIAKSNQADRIITLNLRNVPSIKRLQMIDLQMQESHPALVVIDGIADLIEGMDYNDQVQADETITQLSRIAEQYDAVVITAIHTNNKDDFATGWLGRLLKQKCVLELAVKREDKDSPTRTIEPTAVRHHDFKPISFEIRNTADDLGEVIIIDPQQIEDEKREKKTQEYRDKLMDFGINPPLTISRADLQKKIQDVKNLSKQGACNFITRCIRTGALKVDGNSVIFDYV